jgi:topoisomerase-4 subunit A
MTVSEVLKRNTEKLQEYLRRELEIELAKLLELFHQKTLEQIFIENRIYKRIEECKTNEKVFKEVRAGLDEFRKLLNRDITDEDIQRLLSIPIRRISLFDINKNKKDLDEILEQIDEINKNLKRLKAYTIKYLESLIEKYGELFPRRTEIEHFDKIDRTKVALNNIKIGWDRKNGYIGTNVKSDELIRCNEYDHLLLVERTGQYKVINITDKVYVGKLFEFRKYDKDTEFGVIYTDKKTKKTYAKRCVIDKFITDREYQLCPDDCRLEVFTPRSDSVYQCEIDIRRGEKTLDINLKEAPLRSAKARGFLATSKLVNKIKFLNYLEPDEEEENEMTEMPEGETASESETPPAEIETTEMQETVNEVENQPEEIEEPEPEKEPAPEKQAEDKPEKKPKTEEKPKAKAEKKKEPVPEPEAEPEPEKPKKEEKTEKKVDKKPEVEPEPEAPKPEEKEEKSEEKSKNKPEDKPKDKDDDNWGITQPEFGF